MTDHFLTSRRPLFVDDAVCAAIVVEDDVSYLMQLRDERDDIFYPGYWGFFGGAVDGQEEPIKALKRELYEELQLDVRHAVLFTRFDIDLSPMGLGSIYRIYYEVTISRREFEGLVLGEGTMMKTFSRDEALSLGKIVPYDSFALWLHSEKHRLRFNPKL